MEALVDCVSTWAWHDRTQAILLPSVAGDLGEQWRSDDPHHEPSAQMPG